MVELKVYKCPFCGGQLPIGGDGTVKCEFCGNTIVISDIPGGSIGADGHETNLTIRYDASHYITVPDMQTVIDGKTYYIRNHSEVKLSLIEGGYDILFKSSIRKRNYHIDLKGEKTLQVGWNRITGSIKVTES